MNFTRHMQVAVRRNFAAFGDVEIAVFEHSSNEKGLTSSRSSRSAAV
jgi:hypothetical protein